MVAASRFYDRVESADCLNDKGGFCGLIMVFSWGLSRQVWREQRFDRPILCQLFPFQVLLHCH